MNDGINHLMRQLLFSVFLEETASEEEKCMDVKGFIHDSLEKLKALGIDAVIAENALVKSVLSMPADMLEDMEEKEILGLLLDNLAIGIREKETDELFCMSGQIYSFDMEGFGIEEMYTSFIEGLSKIVKDDFIFTDIEEDASRVDFESGTGIQTIRFQCNEKVCRYDANVEYDWFDTGMLTYMNQVIKECNTGKCLYVTSDGWQNCILFYQTEEWAQHFQELLGITLQMA